MNAGADQTTGPRALEKGGLGPLPIVPWSGKQPQDFMSNIKYIYIYQIFCMMSKAKLLINSSADRKLFRKQSYWLIDLDKPYIFMQIIP